MTSSVSRTGVAKLWLLNLLANAALLVVWYFWLLIPDAREWQLALSGLIAITAVVLVLWLRAGTLAWFRVAGFRSQGNVWCAYRESLRHVPALGFWLLLFVVLAWMIWSLHSYVPQFAVWLRQKLGAGPSPRSIMKELNWLLVLIVFFLMPALWLPIGTTVATVGVHPEHLAASRRVWRRPSYWLWFALLLGAVVYVPYRLLRWIPEFETLRQQAWSMGARFLLAYVVLVTAFIAIVWMTAVLTDRDDPIAAGSADL